MSSPAQSKGVMGATGNSASDRRRSSAGSQKFANLHDLKRNSVDATAAARKASFAEQSAPKGMLGGLWESFTKGGGNK